MGKKLNVNAKEFDQARVNGGSNYRCFEIGFHQSSFLLLQAYRVSSPDTGKRERPLSCSNVRLHIP